MAHGHRGTGQFPQRLTWPAARLLPWRYIVAAGIAAVLAGAGAPRLAMAQTAGVIQDNGTEVRRLTVTRNKSRTFTLARPFASAVVGSPDIADVLPMSETVLYIQGKKAGSTNVSVFGKDKQLITVVDVDVAVDTQYIARNIRASIASPGIRISGSGNQVVLSGEAMSAPDAERAFAIAQAMVPGDSGVTVINAMKVAPSQQVMLKVRFLEVDRSAAREIGVNWFGANGSKGFNTGLGSPSHSTAAGLPLFKAARTFASGTTADPFGVAIANLAGNGTTLDVMLTALEKKGLLRSLAEPDLVALSGETASFTAGGRVPVPTVQASSSGTPLITTEYQKYGVTLNFVPTVLSNGIINLRMGPSVSALDYTNAVVNQGYRIPALTVRETNTTVELRDGQSFAISGLLQSDNIRDIQQVPWAGSLPVLGALFRSTSYQQKETELVVIVTPHLVAPAVPGQQLSSPLDQRLPANDRDLFLMGQTDVRKKYQEYVATGGQSGKPYGHIMPVMGN